MLLKWEATFLLTTCKLNVLLDRCWLRLVVSCWLLSNLTYLTLYHLSLLLGIWSLHLPTIQLVEPTPVSRLMCIQSDVGGDDFTYLDAELLNLV